MKKFKTVVTNIIKWLKESNRLKHLCNGFLIGLVPLEFIDGVFAGTVAGACLEYKDKAYGNKWDWIDLALTSLGGTFGALFRLLLNSILK